MTAQIKRWGNSAAVRIPSSQLAAAGLKVDDRVEVREEDGRIVIEATGPKPVSLDELLAGIAPENLHEEIDFGPPQGKELW